MTTLFQDLRYGLRMLRKSPGFTVIAIMTLALGIGANTAIFSVVNAVLLRPLPFPQAEQLAFVTSSLEAQPGIFTRFGISYPDFLDWRSNATSFTGMASYHGDSFTLTGMEQPLHVTGATVSGDFFSVLGTTPFLGRGFTREEEKPGTHVVVLSHELWKSAFHGDHDIVGRAITMDKQSYTVVGVMPADFLFPVDADPPKLWRTFAIEAETPDPKNEPAVTSQRGAHFLNAIARVKPGISIGQAREEMNVITKGLAAQYPDTNRKFSVAEVVPELERLVGETRPRLVILLVSVGVVLLIACLNVANLLLVRASKRSREIAVRAALGAKRVRVVRQMLTESVVLGVGGALLGIPLAIWALKLFISMNEQDLPRIQSANLDGTVMAFTAGLALLTSIVFGLVPALRTSNPNLTQFLKEGRGTTAGSSHHHLRSGLVVAETAFGLVLLIVAGLLLRSFNHLLSVDPGLNSHGVLTLTFDLPDKKYSERQQVDFYNQLLARLQTLPGVVSASGVTPMPFSGNNAVISFQIEGHPVPRSEAPSADIKVATPGYFRTLGIPVISGRDFNEHDESTAPGVVIVNEAFARRFFPQENALGKRFTPGASNKGKPAAREIIAVVGNVKGHGLDSKVTPEYYIPFAQLNFGSMTVCLRTSVDPHSITSAVRNVVASMDADLPLYDIKTMDEYLSASVATPRFHAMLLEAFAGLALLLTALGLYGVVAFTVAQRTHEIGVRITLGATRASVTQMVLSAGFKLTAIGIAIGVVGSLVAARFLTAFTSLLFGVKATDTLTFLVVVCTLAAVSLLACYVPARRAAKVDPMIALRYE